MKIIITESQYQNIVNILESGLRIKNLNDEPIQLDYVELAHDVFKFDENNWGVYLKDYPKLTPAIEENERYLRELENVFKKNKGGLCWENNQCFTKLITYKNPEYGLVINEYNWIWDNNIGEGKYEFKTRLIPEIKIYRGKKMNKDEKIQFICNELKKFGVSDVRVVAAIIGTANKESGLKPVSETTHKGTLAQVREWFPPLRNLNDYQVQTLQNDAEAFYNYVYHPLTKVGKNLGNHQEGHGFKYRGRGLNGITGYEVYKNVGYEDNPDALMNLTDALIALIKYYDYLGFYNKNYPPDTPFINILKDIVYATGGWSKDKTGKLQLQNLQKSLEYIQNNLVHDGYIEVPGYKPVKYV
jgi:predicted chitinase